MEILKAKEAAKIVPISNGRESLLSAKLKQLQPGEALLILPTDVKNKKSMYRTINKVAKKMNWKMQNGFLADGSAWIAKRVG